MSFIPLIQPTPLNYLGVEEGNDLYIKRDDLLPFSFGGNKVRKAVLFFEDLQKKGADCVVTYGSASSNHCRVVANMAAALGLHCVLISTDAGSASLSRILCKQFGAEVIVVPVDNVAETIDRTMKRLCAEGYKPYFIPGGGHGNIGTRAYDLAYDEIKNYEKQNSIRFDYIFLASGTGTTQAGLVCGKLRCNDAFRTIVGISIARENPRGRSVVVDSVKDYCGSSAADEVQFLDLYRCGGYGRYDQEITDTIDRVMMRYGVPLDPTYTGKAFNGMLKYLRTEKICGRNILFIHTGGTPIYQDWMVRR